MKLRKLLAMTLVVAMTGALAAGCGSKSEETGAEGEGEQQTAEWDASNDITVVSREDGSGTRGAFIELFGIEQKDENGNKVDHTTEDANITNSTEVMMSTVAGNEYAIGYVSLGSLGDSVKAVKIDGAEATEENIKAGTYKVSRPFNIATKDEISDIAQDFINFILSEEGQKVVSENGYISLDDVKPYESNGATGKVVVAGSSSVTPVMEKLKEAYQKVNSGAEIEINQSDSTTGMTSAMSGICDIGMASRERLIVKSDAGLDTVIGERGIGLSEGQAQRVAVARALLSRAPILLLDESTSALDEETEAKLLGNIASLKEKTCLIVTHRKAALKICDYRIHIENGGVKRMEIST